MKSGDVFTDYAPTAFILRFASNEDWYPGGESNPQLRICKILIVKEFLVILSVCVHK